MPRPSLVQCASPGDGERRTACKALSSPQGHPADTGLASLFFRTRRFHCVAARNAALSSTARKARAERSCNQPTRATPRGRRRRNVFLGHQKTARYAQSALQPASRIKRVRICHREHKQVGGPPERAQRVLFQNTLLGRALNGHRSAVSCSARSPRSTGCSRG